jgi:hypothetical protein
LTPASREHWFDRLAAPHTRRQGLKAAFAGAALTLPLGRAASALADNPQSNGDPHACQKGCFYAAHTNYAAAGDRCYRQGNPFPGVAALLYGQLFAGAGLVGGKFIAAVACQERNRLVQKAAQYDCVQPNCPGFDPAAENGPCFNCLSHQNTVCCPDPTSFFGYSCCSTNEPQPYCCRPGGGCRICGS